MGCGASKKTAGSNIQSSKGTAEGKSKSKTKKSKTPSSSKIKVSPSVEDE